MKFIVKNGLPITNVKLTYNDESMMIENVLIDTGSAVTIFDTDIVENIGLTIDPSQGKAVYMYGVGGKSEVCFQQQVKQLIIDNISLEMYTVQLGMTMVPYGFNAILGADFFSKTNASIDFRNYQIYY
ncbi:MAG: aspartyl protease family protein [Vulcanibacillus sp.]